MPEVILGGKTFTYQPGQKGDKWFYHTDGRACLAFSFEADELYEAGFFDSPDDFPSHEAEIAHVSDDQHDIGSWDKDKLVDYAYTVFGVKLKKNFSQPNLVKQVEELEKNGDV